MTVLRKACDGDVEAIRRWRNHPEVRRHFIHTAEITPEQHRTWWSKVSADPGTTVLVYEIDCGPAGVVIFQDHDHVARTAEWGFFLDVDGLRARDRLLPVWIRLERAAIRYGFEELGLTVLGGRTLASNVAVLELHRRCGFREVPQRRYTTEIDGVDREVLWIELRSGQ
jgi:RimJ/RimL family protein N-acetyltransferase